MGGGTRYTKHLKWRALVKINMIITLRLSSEKRLQGDLRAVVQQQTAQWLPGQVPMAGALPKKDSPGRVTHLSLFPRRALAGQGQYDRANSLDT